MLLARAIVIALDFTDMPIDISYAKRQAGLCVVGRNSACNGDPYDENGRDGKTWSNWHRYQIEPKAKREADPAYGICVVGADSPCNGPTWRGGEKREAEPVPAPAPVEEEKKREADPAYGLCVIGVDSQCNGEGWGPEKREAEPVPAPVEEEKREAEPEADRTIFFDVEPSGPCEVGRDSPCNGGRWGLEEKREAEPKVDRHTFFDVQPSGPNN